MTENRGDLRQEDQELLTEHGVDDFGRIWEESLTKMNHADRNQERWHLSRMSMLAGYLLGSGSDTDEVIEMLNEHQQEVEEQR